MSWLRPMLDREDEIYNAVPALASVGRHLPEVRQCIINLAKPRPPQWKTEPSVPDYRHDVTMFKRGTAIGAMGYLTNYPEECVPVLIDAMDNFEEYDPDVGYDGPLERISGTLSLFGAQAGAAAVPLACHLNDEPEEWPQAILRALAAMGPATREALPQLEAFREEHAEEDEPSIDLDAAPADKELDPAGWAIQKIRG